MTEEFDELKRVLRDEGSAAPRKAARHHAIEKGMLAFDEKYLFATKGTGLGDRLRNTAIAVYEALVGRRPMKLTYALMGGASLSVLLLAILSTNYLQTELMDGQLVSERVAPTPAAEPSALSTPLEGAPKKVQTETIRMAEERRELPAAPIAPLSLVSPSTSADEAFPAAAPPTFEIVARPSPVGSSTPSESERQTMADRLHPDQQVSRYHQDRDEFTTIKTNPVKLVAREPVSTFSIDVDTASYSFVRASLNNSVLPQKDAVRVEELINYFPYDYSLPDDKSVPFKAGVSVFPSPWNLDKKLIHIGIKGFDLNSIEKPASNLVFLIDTSGSMDEPNKLPLVRNAMKLLLESLKPDDTVAIVTYAGRAGTVLEPTPAKDRSKILRALDNLQSGGRTAGAEGIRQAYQLAEDSFRENGVNRIILATDGDFNVGMTDDEELKSYIERKRKTGISLSVLGFGRGNYNDALMQTLAQNGNGNAAYIDSLSEARKVLVEEASSTLFTIAKDVKIQVEFNPAIVSEYRLIGYETRLLNREDFNNDRVDAGDIGSGHTVTAIYEITPKGSASQSIDDLRYGTTETPADTSSDEYAFLKIRYKLPDEESSKLITTPITPDQEFGTVGLAPNETRFATAVAAFGQILRGGSYTGSFTLDDVIDLAQSSKGSDEFGYRAEFINLVRLSMSVSPQP